MNSFQRRLKIGNIDKEPSYYTKCHRMEVEDGGKLSKRRHKQKVVVCINLLFVVVENKNSRRRNKYHFSVQPNIISDPKITSVVHLS